MKKAVLCVTREALNLADGTYILPYPIKDIPSDQFHFVNRNVCNGMPDIGYRLPQLIGYAIMKCGDEVFTYARKGTEARLHGLRSLGVGGHVDIEDFDKDSYKAFQTSLITSTEREIWEETNYAARLGMTAFDSLIVDTSNEVGKVHLGIPIIVEVEDKSMLRPDASEMRDPKWVKITDLQDSIREYENWSQLIISLLNCK